MEWSFDEDYGADAAGEAQTFLKEWLQRQWLALQSKWRMRFEELQEREEALNARETQFLEDIQKRESELAARWKEVEEAQERLAAEQATHRSTLQQLKDTAHQAADQVRLNVGGKIFHTTKQTLLGNEPRTFFEALLNLPPNEAGEYFIDRDAEWFPTILTYLRKGNIARGLGRLDVDLSTLLPKIRQKLFDEAEFYQIASLRDLLTTASLSDSGYVNFVGFAEWHQDARSQTDEAQDDKMNEIAAQRYPGSRAATQTEYQKGLIRSLPEKNMTGRLILFCGPDTAGREDPLAASGHLRLAVAQFAHLDGTCKADNALAGIRAVVCVSALPSE
eukprot:TRINITY_DN5681_c0_g1_i1.p3 TRINITY_DN5681_c0_g1~~TRINITY_DN5681_c0_g1_i1.p3  ORF type:complete len:333 (-),score=71.22 TRINITY_DN5681_c0_g1_i1:2351-3349(-)